MADSYLGTLLRMYTRAHDTEFRDIAAAIGRHPSQLTRIVHGSRCALSHNELERLVRAVTPDRDEQANLVVAYLLDQCPPEYRDDVEIRNARDIQTAGEAQSSRP